MPQGFVSQYTSKAYPIPAHRPMEQNRLTPIVDAFDTAAHSSDRFCSIHSPHLTR